MKDFRHGLNPQIGRLRRLVYTLLGILAAASVVVVTLALTAGSCGWQGDRWERVISPADADFNRRRDYVSPDDSAHASPKVEGAIHNEWKAHIAPPKHSCA